MFYYYIIFVSLLYLIFNNNASKGKLCFKYLKNVENYNNVMNALGPKSKLFVGLFFSESILDSKISF